MFEEDLHIQPLPHDESTALALAAHLHDQVRSLGSRAAVAKAAVDGIHGRLSDTTPSEAGRLQRLYAVVYTREELERLMLDTMDHLGVKD